MYGTWILGLPSTLMPAVKYGGELVARSQWRNYTQSPLPLFFFSLHFLFDAFGRKKKIWIGWIFDSLCPFKVALEVLRDLV